MCDFCDSEDSEFDVEVEGRYLGHGEWDTETEHHCKECAVEHFVICCLRNCQGACTWDDYDDWTQDEVNAGRANWIDAI